MTLYQLILSIAGSIASFGLLVGGLGYLIQTYRRSGQEAITGSDNIADFWKKQSEDYKEMMTVKELASTKQINDLTREVGELRGQLNAEKTQNEKLERIFQNRNPEMESFMKTMLAVAQQSQSYMESTGKINSEVLLFMQKINKHLEAEAASEMKIEGTVTKH